MKVSELMLLLRECNPDVTVKFVNEKGYFSDIEFVESRLQSPNGCDATVCLYEEKPTWLQSEDYQVEQISADYVFATTKYHDL